MALPGVAQSDASRAPATSAEPSAALTPGPWAAFNMVHAERGDAMTAEELGEYVKANVLKSIEDGGSADRFLIISNDGPELGPDICHVGNGPSGPANAHLIAAAPDLLATAQRLVAEISEYPPSAGEDDDETVEVLLGDLKDLRWAVARALGQ